MICQYKNLVLGQGPSSESDFSVDDNGVACTTCLKDRGQLGVGANVNKNVLTLVDFDDDIEVAHVSAYGDHTLSG